MLQIIYFLDLIELNSVTVKGVFVSIINCFRSYGMTVSFLNHNLISLTCDGTAVMIGEKQ